MASTKLMHTKDGKPFYRIVVTPQRGKQYSTRFYPEPQWSKKTTERQLAKFAADFENRCKNGEIQTRADKKAKAHQEELERAKLKTFQQYYESVYYPTKKQTSSKKTISDYDSYFRLHYIPVFGDYQLSEITPAMIKKALLDFGKNHSHSSTIKYYVLLNGFFDMAFMDDSITVNPMLKIKRPKENKDVKKTPECGKALTVEQVRHIFECLEQEPLKWQAYITLCTDTGCRRCELVALQWNDIDFVNGEASINKSIGYTKEDGEYITTPKNGKVRVVDIGEDTLRLLRSLKREQAEHSILSQWIFTQDGSAERMFFNSPTGYFTQFGKRCGIEKFHPHLLRHTSATLSILNGADVASVSARLGHADISTTLRMYTHPNQEAIRKAGNIFRNVLKKESV